MMKVEKILATILILIVLSASYLYLEGSKVDPKQGGRLATIKLQGTPLKELTLEEKNKAFQKAPEIVSPQGFLNTGGKQITLGEFVGKKVVLIDFWTYSCINCQRTLPYLNAWYEKYKDQGLEIVSIHTPEFAFEKLEKNVQDAVDEANIKYPVVLDNNFSTWNAFDNNYWPRKYLVDIDGFIIYDHIGEGAYEETERAIQRALKERSERLKVKTVVSETITDPKNKINVQSVMVKSPEVYFGASRNDLLANGKQRLIGKQNISLPENFQLNQLYLNGEWNINEEYSEGGVSTSIVFFYSAKDVYMVLSGERGTEIDVYIDDKFSKSMSVNEEKLYTIFGGSNYGERKLEVKVKKGNLRAFTFTFG